MWAKCCGRSAPFLTAPVPFAALCKETGQCPLRWLRLMLMWRAVDISGNLLLRASTLDGEQSMDDKHTALSCRSTKQTYCNLLRLL